MVKRRRGHPHEKENECPDSSRIEYSKLDNANPIILSTRCTGESLERDVTSTRDAREQLTESVMRGPEGAIDGHILSQGVLKAKFRNVFYQQREIEGCNKNEGYKENDRQGEMGNSRRRSSSTRRPPSAKRSSRTGTEKRKNIQAVLAELKTRVRRISKETNFESILRQDVTQLGSAEMSQAQLAPEIASEGLSSERLFLSPQSSTGSLTAWLSRPKHQRSSVESVTVQNRRSPFRCDPSRGRSSGIFGSGMVNYPSLSHFGGEHLRQRSSLDTKLPQKGRAKNRRQQRRRNLPLRRTKSSNSLRAQRGSGFFWEDPDVLVELSAEATLLDKIQELRTTLERSEKALKDFVEESTRHRAEIQEQVRRLAALYSSLSQSQDMRYRSLLEVFHENYKLLGYVESNFDYVLSVVARGRRTNLQEYFSNLLQFIAHHAMTPILWIIRYGSRVYLRLFPRRTGPNG